MNQLETSGKDKNNRHSSILSIDSNGNQSKDSDDVNSLCSRLSNISKISAVSRNNSFLTGSLQNTTNKNPQFRRNYEELLSQPLNSSVYSVIKFDSSQNVQEFQFFGENISFKKQSNRGTNNPWRRYGALRKLHEIGGFAPSGNKKQDRKRRDKLTCINKNSKPPQPPTCSQMTLNKTRNKGKNSSSLILQIPKNVDACKSAQILALQIKNYVLNHGRYLTDIANEENAAK